MLKWIYTNINHLTVPFGMLLGLLAAIMGFTNMRQRKAGIERPQFSPALSIVAAVILVAAFVFAGMLIAHGIG
jgi:hypothetical protein